MHLSLPIIPTLLLTLLPSTPISAIPITTNPIDISARDVPPLPGPNPEPTCPTLPRTPHDKEITQGKYLKITMLVRKHVDVTDDYFHKYWTKCDVPLALDCPAFTENAVRYTSQHQTPTLKAELGASGYPMADYDGITEVWVENLVARQKVTSSECWQTVRADAMTFTTWPYTFMYSYKVLGLDRT